MAKTNWQDPKTSEIRSTHISGLQEAVGKIEESIGVETVSETNIPLEEVFISNDDRCRIFQAPEGKRNWLSSPTPVINKNGTVIIDDFEIDYGGGAIIFTNPILPTDTLTADVTYTKKVEGKGLSTNDYTDNEKQKNQDNADNIVNLIQYVGDLENLTTEEKSNIVGALNEIDNDIKTHKAEKATQAKSGHVMQGVGVSIDTNGVLSAGEFKLGNFIRDVSLEGEQTISGIGFRPRCALFFAAASSIPNVASWGMDTGNSRFCLYDQSNAMDGSYEATVYSIRCYMAAGVYLSGHITSFNDDGFTINWVKTGSPTGGSVNVIYITLK